MDQPLKTINRSEPVNREPSTEVHQPTENQQQKWTSLSTAFHRQSKSAVAVGASPNPWQPTQFVPYRRLIRSTESVEPEHSDKQDLLLRVPSQASAAITTIATILYREVQYTV